MATIDLIVLGMLKQQPLSAYDIQKLVEYRTISRWVKISTPSIYKKVLQLEEKGLIVGNTVKEGNMAEKTVYQLTASGDAAFERLMLEIARKPIYMFLDFNAVIVNLASLPPEQQQACLTDIEAQIQILKANLEENLQRKASSPEIPQSGLAVLQQQLLLAQTLEQWITSVKEPLMGSEVS